MTLFWVGDSHCKSGLDVPIYLFNRQQLLSYHASLTSQEGLPHHPGVVQGQVPRPLDPPLQSPRALLQRLVLFRPRRRQGWPPCASTVFFRSDDPAVPQS